MLMFGLFFVFYFVKLSVGNGFWSNLRAADPVTHGNAITLQRSSRKLKKAEFDLKCLLNCRDNNVHLNPILDGGGGANLPPTWFFEYSSETVRSRKLKLCDF